jgi:hypothetical protein
MSEPDDRQMTVCPRDVCSLIHCQSGAGADLVYLWSATSTGLGEHTRPAWLLKKFSFFHLAASDGVRVHPGMQFGFPSLRFSELID